MPTLTNTLINAAGRPRIGVPVEIELAGHHWTADGIQEVLPQSVWSGSTDGRGVWSVNLPAQSQYEGATHYLVREGSGLATHVVTIADSPDVQLLRARIDPNTPVAPGTPGRTYVLDTDSRLTDPRVPLPHAASHAAGGPDVLTPAAIGAAPSGHTHPAGSSATASEIQVSGVAAGPLSGHRIVTRRPDGLLGYADNTVGAHAHAPLWMTLGAISDGATGSALAYGAHTEPTWSWVPGAPLFLGAAGFITATPPSAPALFLAAVGFATGATSVFIDRQPSISLI